MENPYQNPDAFFVRLLQVSINQSTNRPNISFMKSWINGLIVRVMCSFVFFFFYLSFPSNASLISSGVGLSGKVVNITYFSLPGASSTLLNSS